MCDPNQMDNDLTSAHFYDDIDQISKVAKERAMMIKRLEEEEARQVTFEGSGDDNVRSGGWYMPDLIPSEQETKTIADADEVSELDRNDTKMSSKRLKKAAIQEDKGMRIFFYSVPSFYKNKPYKNHQAEISPKIRIT